MVLQLCQPTEGYPLVDSIQHLFLTLLLNLFRESIPLDDRSNDVLLMTARSISSGTEYEYYKILVVPSQVIMEASLEEICPLTFRLDPLSKASQIERIWAPLLEFLEINLLRMVIIPILVEEVEVDSHHSNISLSLRLRCEEDSVNMQEP